MKKTKKKAIQKYTKPHKKGRPQNPYDSLELHNQIAIDLRLHNMGHSQITIELNKVLKKAKVDKQFSENTVRDWFAKNGICVAGFNYRKKILSKENAERIKAMDSKLMEAAADAIVVVHDRIRSHSLQAALETLKIVKESKKKDDKPPVINSTVIYVPSNGR